MRCNWRIYLVTINSGVVPLDLGADTTIALEWRNPQTREDNEGYTFSFELPRTPRNREALEMERHGWPTPPLHVRIPRDTSYWAILRGLPYTLGELFGDLYIKGRTERGYTCEITMGKQQANALKQWEKDLLRTIPYGEGVRREHLYRPPDGKVDTSGGGYTNTRYPMATVRDVLDGLPSLMGLRTIDYADLPPVLQTLFFDTIDVYRVKDVCGILETFGYLLVRRGEGLTVIPRSGLGAPIRFAPLFDPQPYRAFRLLGPEELKSPEHTIALYPLYEMQQRNLPRVFQTGWYDDSQYGIWSRVSRRPISTAAHEYLFDAGWPAEALQPPEAFPILEERSQRKLDLPRPYLPWYRHAPLYFGQEFALQQGEISTHDTYQLLARLDTPISPQPIGAQWVHALSIELTPGHLQITEVKALEQYA